MAFGGRTILFAWELGEGLGHLPALKAVARGVKAEGGKPVFVLRDPVLTRAALAEIEAPVLPAPHWPRPAPPAALSGTYADILAGNGYGHPQTLIPQIEAWDQMFGLFRPDLVVCEHAPTAALTAFQRIPVAFVGNGFVVPPADAPEFPPFEPNKGEPQRQRPILEAVQAALSALKRPAPQALTEPFRGAFRGIYSFPMLDTYRHARREPLLGPIEPMPAVAPLPAKRRAFVYSASDYALLNELSQALMDLGPEAAAFFRGAVGARGGILKSRGVEVHDEAPSLPDVLGQASVVFSHGGTGFANAALAAGRPHVIAPRHFEAYATGRAIEELGAGILVQPFDVKRFKAAVKRAHDDSAMRDAALKAAMSAQAFLAQATPLETTLQALRKVLG